MKRSAIPTSEMKTVLVTGATGFLGSHICKKFISKNYNVLAYRRPTSDHSKLSGVNERVSWYDISDGYEKPFRDGKRIDCVIHLATNYGRGASELVDQIEANLVFPIKIMELSRKYGVSQFINTSSFIVKGLGHYDFLQGYALSKAQCSQWSKMYAQHFEVVDVILEHVYGDNDNPDKFIPMVITRLLDDSEYIDFTEGEQLRDFVYAGDVATAYEVIVNQSKAGQPGYKEVDIGSGHLSSIKKLVCEIEGIIDSGTALRFGALPYRDNEIMSSKCDDSMFDHYDWKAETSLLDGLRKTIAFYEN